MTASRKLLAASGGVAAAFDPESDITWHSLFWAEGTNFAAESYSDTDTITTWPNETTEADASTITGSVTYDAVNAGLNDQPSVTFPGGTARAVSPTFTSNPSYTSGVSIVCIAKRTTGTGSTYVDGLTSSTRNVIAAATNYYIFAGTVEAGSTPRDEVARMFVAQFDGSTGNDTLEIDGNGDVDTNAGSQTLTGVTLGNNYAGSAALTGDIAFVGIYEGDITADGSWADFETWVSDHYGITIA